MGSDGTNSNVGRFQGCIAYLEKHLGHAVHWEICLLHGNELPFWALLIHYDGKTSGPSAFKGPIGKALQEDLTQETPIKFERIENPDFPELPEDVVCDLSHEQEYMYDMGWGIIRGELDEDFCFREPGMLHHARWNPLANRIMLKYVTTKNPSYKLKRLTHISVEFYVPSWFWIKSHPHCVDGPKNLLKMIEFSRKLKPKEQKIAQKSIQRNGFYAHPEAILRSMLADDDQSLRKQAVEKILAIRADLAKTTEEDEVGDKETEEEEEEEDEWEDEDDFDAEELILDPSERAAIENSTVREFEVPKINFEPTSSPNLIN